MRSDQDAEPFPAAGGMSPGEQMIEAVLSASHLIAPDDLAEMMGQHAAMVGVEHLVIYLADLQQLVLTPIPSPAGSAVGTPLAVDATLAGLAYRSVSVRFTTTDAGRTQVWVPVVDGVQRLGVLEATVGELDELMLRRLHMLASLIALLILSKAALSDTFARLRRVQPMSLAAEMEWAFMPPLAFATERVAVVAALEPCYDVGGDAFDYAITNDVLHLSVFDAMGHDLRAGAAASIGMTAGRNARRSGKALTDMVAVVDDAIAGAYTEVQYLTGILTELDLRDGTLRWVNCGQPPPLLVRDRKVIKHLRSKPRPPLGLGATLGTGTAIVHEEQLQPGDRVLFYTDGVVGNTNLAGEEFGLDRLTDLIIRNSVTGIPPVEALRRLTQALLGHRLPKLDDDATVVLLEWTPDDLTVMLP